MAALSDGFASAALALSLNVSVTAAMVLILFADGSIAHAGQHLGSMHDAHRASIPGELARDIHQTAKIPAKQQIGAGALDGFCLFANDGVGDVRIFHAEGAAETTANVVARQRLQLQALNRGQQSAWLFENAQLAQARAAIVIGCCSLKG